MRVWRLCRARHAATAFDGEGARLFGGRWNEKGMAVV
jgi:RES domain-containing protein